MTRALSLVLAIFASSVAFAKAEGPLRESAPAPGHLMRPGLRPFRDADLAKLKVPEGFKVQVFARGVEGARMMVQTEGGAVIVSSPSKGKILRLNDKDGDGAADEMTELQAGLDHPHGLALAKDGRLFFVALTEVFSLDLATAGAKPVNVLTHLPGVGQHENRSLAISPDGSLFVAIAANCNSCVDPDKTLATLQASALDGSGRATFAKGLRDTIGFDWQPSTGKLFGMDHGVDWRGDEIPPEELNLLEKDHDYGWPFCFADKHPDPNLINDPEGETKEAYCARTTAPLLTFPAHSAPIAFKFYGGASFPKDYVGSAFVAMHGSWNRKSPVGYEVQRIVFANDLPTRAEPFLTGFLDKAKKEIFGRPAGLAVLKDGSLLVSDDANGMIYRVSHP